MNEQQPQKRTTRRNPYPHHFRLEDGWNERTIETPVRPVKVRWRGDPRDVATAMLRNAMQVMSQAHGRSIER